MAHDIHELSALYALDALDDEDRSRYEAHLDDCERCREDVAGFRVAASSLAFAHEAPVPPEVLRTRVLDAVRAEPQNVVSLRGRRPVIASTAAALAAVATVAAVGLGVWASTLHHSLARDRAALKILGDPNARHIPVSGVTGTLVVAPSGAAALAVDLPSPPSGKQYEAWIIDKTVHRAGVFSGPTTTLTLPLHAGATVKVTLERAGGVDAPTTQPLLSAHV